MRRLYAMKRLVVAGSVVGVLVFALSAEAGKKPPGGGGDKCPRDIGCPDVWDPVICSDGVVYSNGCYAFQQCATGCVPYGDGGPVAAKPGGGGGSGGKCPRDIGCPDVWDPVICSNGVVYSNGCYAFQQCATGCVPYGEGGAQAKPGGGGGGGGGTKCPRDILCPDVMDPVICSDGNIYSNGCYAYQQCATGCVPYGDGT